MRRGLTEMMWSAPPHTVLPAGHPIRPFLKPKSRVSRMRKTAGGAQAPKISACLQPLNSLLFPVMNDVPNQSADRPVSETVLLRAKQELEHMIDLNPQGMALLDRSGIVRRANRALLELLDLRSFKDVLDRNIASLFPAVDSEIFRELLTSATGYETREVAMKPYGGRQRSVRFTLVNSGSDNDASVIIVRDITAEREEAHYHEKACKKEAIKALVGALMHDLNQPLTVIMARAHLMQLALEKSPAGHHEDLQAGLEEISSLTVRIADTLRRLESPRDYVTQPYTEGIEILDIGQSGEEIGPWRDATDMAMRRLLAALDTHEPGARLHSERTAAYARRISRLLGLNDAQADIVGRGAAFHDIGKLGIPDSILQKPSSLEPAERKVMETHAEMGARIVGAFFFYREEAKAAHCHHERFDGRGYPRGLSGASIPLAGRIVAVADAFDALRFHREYRNPSPLESVAQEIIRGAGSQFDPEVVRAFNECYRELDSMFPHMPNR